MATHSFFSKYSTRLLNYENPTITIRICNQRETRFFVVPASCKSGQVLSNANGRAELQSVDEELFATFETEFGKITYIFLENGLGFKIGPGIFQQNFQWY